MLAFFRVFILFLFCFFSVHLFANKQEIKMVYNPKYVDSLVIKYVDSGLIKKNFKKININQYVQKGERIQPLLHKKNKLIYFYAVCLLFVFLLIIKLIFSNFVGAVLDGLLDEKKYFIYLKSNKYDSPLGLISLFVLSNLLLATIVSFYLRIINFHTYDFQYLLFLKIISIVFLFFFIKLVIEYFFNFIIDSTFTFKAFFIQNLFIEIAFFSIVLLCSLCFIYNNFALQYVYEFGAFMLFFYLFFTVLKSFQLLQQIHLSNKIYFILYICTLKILPILLLAKYILSINSY